MNDEIIGYHEDEFLPYIYAPYVPLIQTPLVFLDAEILNDLNFILKDKKEKETEVDWMKEGF